MFANYTGSLSKNLGFADPDLADEVQSDPAKPAVSSEARLKGLNDNLKRFEDNFSRHLKILLDALNYLAATETVVFLGLCARLSMANEGIAGTSLPAAYG